MFKNYLRTALRNLFKYRGFSLINLLGLAMGMACCILILLFVRYELSYDAYHENSDRIYRVTREWFNEDGTSSLHLGHVAPPIGLACSAKSLFSQASNPSIEFQMITLIPCSLP